MAYSFQRSIRGVRWM